MAGEFALLREEHRQAQIQWQKDVKQLIGDPPQRTFEDTTLPPAPWKTFRVRYRELAERRLAAGDGLHALQWLVFGATPDDAASMDDALWAFKMLSELHASHPEISGWCAASMVLTLGRGPAVAFCERITAENATYAARWDARHVIARILAIDRPGVPDDATQPRDVCGARAALDEVILHAPDADRAKRARGFARELDLFQIGMPAPNLEGMDQQGRTLRLSDFRGRVVLVHFWGWWCYPGRVALPAKRKLLVELRGQPFALLGVNADSPYDAFRESIAKEAITWPNVWTDLKQPDSMAEQWNISAWPTYFLIDRDGILCGKPRDEADLPKLAKEQLSRTR